MLAGPYPAPGASGCPVAGNCHGNARNRMASLGTAHLMPIAPFSAQAVFGHAVSFDILPRVPSRLPLGKVTVSSNAGSKSPGSWRKGTTSRHPAIVIECQTDGVWIRQQQSAPKLSHTGDCACLANCSSASSRELIRFEPTDAQQTECCDGIGFRTILTTLMDMVSVLKS